MKSTIDDSTVDFSRKSSSFEINFEKKLYEPPKTVVEDEKRQALLAQQKAKNNRK